MGVSTGEAPHLADIEYGMSVYKILDQTSFVISYIVLASCCLGIWIMRMMNQWNFISQIFFLAKSEHDILH